MTSPTEQRGALPRLCFITDPYRTGGRELSKLVELVCKAGCRMVQVRAPELSDREFYFLARQLTHIAHAFGALSIVNDRIDIAHGVGADGVHLGANDLPVRVARQLLGPEKLLGYSAHTYRELRRVPEEGADYVTFSPVFSLSHKTSAHEPWGVVGLKEALLLSKVPVYALGGITPDNLSALTVLQQEDLTVRIAAVSLLSEAEQVMARTTEVLQALSPGRDVADLAGREARYTFDPEEVLAWEPDSGESV